MKRYRFPLHLALFLALAGAAPEPTGGAEVDRGLAHALRQELTNTFRTQRADGILELDAFATRHPMLASLARVSVDAQPNPAFASQAARAMARYYTSLIGSSDRNGNLLVETTERNSDGDVIYVEEVGRNALLALDLAALARLNLSMHKPLDALHWYDGSRAVARAVVARLYDRDSDFFFPVNVQTQEIVRRYDATSALPFLFGADVGTDLAARAVMNYYMIDPVAGPDLPLSGTTPARIDDALLDTVALLAALRAAGFNAEADSLSRRARGELGKMDAVVSTRAHRRYLAAAMNSSSPVFGDRLLPLDLMVELSQMRGRLPDEERVAFMRAVDDVKFALLAPSSRVFPADTLTALSKSVRHVYAAVSRARTRVQKASYFDQRDSYEYPGVDPGQALERVFDDVVAILQDAENVVFAQRYAASGFYASAALPHTTLVAGGQGEVVWTLQALAAPVEVKSLVSIAGGRADELSDRISLGRGEAPTSFTGRFPVAVSGGGYLSTMTFSLMVEADGVRSQLHARRSVFIEPPVDVVVNFPQGRSLDHTSVPIVVNVTKKTAGTLTLEGQWFSPVGLKLVEGQKFKYGMAADQKEVALPLHVDVPSPCRPGSFPFKIKFHGNGLDLGTVSSSFFKRFQWLCIGPFPAGNAALATTYAPEERIEVMATYNGAGRRVSWIVLPESDVLADGAVRPRGALSASGVGYLYTVVESIEALSTAATLSANAPAALFVNGERIAENRKAGRGTVTARVNMKAGRNHILIKVVGDPTTTVYFNLGDDNSVASDAFNNDLADVLEGYAALVARGGGNAVAAQRLVTLRYVDNVASSVSVIGSFNGWSPEQHRMRRLESGTWEITMSLAPGRYTYRLLIDNREQILDPNSTITEPDGYGGKNSVIVVER